jgi:hypothetical protein
MALLAFLLGGCTSAAPTVGAIATATVDVSTVLVDAAGTDTFYDWQVQIADQSVIRPCSNAVVPPNSQGIFTASSRGQTTLTATGPPGCASATPPVLPRRGSSPSRSLPPE